jgi:5'-nucleotidase
MPLQKKKHILLTNDDGYDAPGLRCMHDALSGRYNITVAAPVRQQSGIGHAFTFEAPLYCEKIAANGRLPGYAIEGTPSDCVKFAVTNILPGRPDIVVAGMNVGENSGVCGFYSGTVGAAREGALWEILSVAFSLEAGGEPYLRQYCAAATEILDNLVKLHRARISNPQRRTFFNVNFPRCPPDACRGVRIARQSTAFFEDRYRSVVNEQGRTGYVIYGERKDLESSDRFDSRALTGGYATITPLAVDATADGMLQELSRWESSFITPH